MRSYIFQSALNMKLCIATILLQVNPINAFIAKYVFADIGFLKWLIWVMALDLLSGVLKAVKKTGWKSVTSKGFRDTVIKCIEYGIFLIVTNALTHYEVNGVANTQFLWLNKIAFEFIILIEIKSVYENITAINPQLDFFSKVVRKVAELFPDKNKKES